MNETEANEEISAFVDGELRGPARDRVVIALYGNAELRRAWARYHLIGDAVRKAGPVPGACSISGKVGEALSGERVAPFEPRVSRRWTRPLSGLALAASVAAVAILGIRGLDGGHDGGVPLPVAGTSRHEAGAVGSAVPEPAARVAAAAVAGPRTPGVPAPDVMAPDVMAMAARRPEADRLQWSGAAPDAEARFNAYLVNYNEYAGSGVRGLLPYVRIVGYQAAARDGR